MSLSQDYDELRLDLTGSHCQSLGDFGVKILFGDLFSVIWRPVQVLATEPDAAKALERCVDYIRR